MVKDNFLSPNDLSNVASVTCVFLRVMRNSTIGKFRV